jgi:hypothetical protein
MKQTPMGQNTGGAFWMGEENGTLYLNTEEISGLAYANQYSLNQ